VAALGEVMKAANEANTTPASSPAKVE